MDNIISSEQYTNCVKQFVIKTLERPSMSFTEASMFAFMEIFQKINCHKFFTDTKSDYDNGIYCLKILRGGDVLFGFHCPPYIQEYWLQFGNEKIPINNKQDKDGYVYFDTPLILTSTPFYDISLHYTYYPCFKIDNWNNITLINGLLHKDIRLKGFISPFLIAQLFENNPINKLKK